MMAIILFIAVATLYTLVTGSFNLIYPSSLGFHQEIGGTPPCGGFVPSLTDKPTELSNGGFPIELRSTLPQADWLFRVADVPYWMMAPVEDNKDLDDLRKQPYNWTNLLPVVHQTGLGNFCIVNLTAPAWLIGGGYVQVVQDTADGTFYQVSYTFTFLSLP